MKTTIKIIQPDDWHVHFRENEMLSVVTKYSSRVNRRCIAMPNTSKPIFSSEQAINYKKIIEMNSGNENFQALIPCYLTNNLNIEDFEFALKNNIFIGGKLYPNNATTNSQYGVNEIKTIYNIFEILEKENSVLLIHGELNRKDIDIPQVFSDDFNLDVFNKTFSNIKNETSTDLIHYEEPKALDIQTNMNYSNLGEDRINNFSNVSDFNYDPHVKSRTYGLQRIVKEGSN